MKYIIECRAKDESGAITGVNFQGFGAGLPDKRTATEIFEREVKSGKWNAVYMEKLYSNGTLIDIKAWYK